MDHPSAGLASHTNLPPLPALLIAASCTRSMRISTSSAVCLPFAFVTARRRYGTALPSTRDLDRRRTEVAGARWRADRGEPKRSRRAVAGRGSLSCTVSRVACCVAPARGCRAGSCEGHAERRTASPTSPLARSSVERARWSALHRRWRGVPPIGLHRSRRSVSCRFRERLKIWRRKGGRPSRLASYRTRRRRQ